MTALTIPAATIPADSGVTTTQARPHLMGAGMPPALRTVGALAALLLAVAFTGLVLMVFAVVMPVLLLAALVSRRWQPRSKRPGWRPATA